jgi:acetyltransferase-like isoleucine patch superfamily enzyme
MISKIKIFVASFLKKYLTKLGYVNYYIHHIDGPKDRLIINGNYDEEYPFVNTIFNTGSGTITIEDGVIFGHNCMVLTGKHNYEAKDKNILRQDVTQGRNIMIGEGSWIASGAMIMGGVIIGKHCVVAAGAVVTKDVPDYSFVAGVPAKIIKKI